MPYWSPDGAKAILVQANNTSFSSLALADGDGQQTAVIGPGWMLGWLDNDTFIYIRPESGYDPAAGGSEMKTELVLSDVSGNGRCSPIFTNSPAH